MNFPRFIVTPEQLARTPVVLTPEDAHHCRILRLRPGDPVLVCDGQGREFSARFVRLTQKSAEIEVLAPTSRNPESELSLTLFQGFARGHKLDWVIEKTTELGITCLVPVISAHSQMKLHDKQETRMDRWQEIARQATRQSGRTRLPQINPPQTFSESLQTLGESDLGIIFYEAQSPTDTWQARLAALPRPSRVGLWVGPEGGFSPEEIALAQSKGVLPVSLGPRILRSETAGMIAVSLAQFFWGDLSGANPNSSPEDEC